MIKCHLIEQRGEERRGEERRGEGGIGEHRRERGRERGRERSSGLQRESLLPLGHADNLALNPTFSRLQSKQFLIQSGLLVYIPI